MLQRRAVRPFQIEGVNQIIMGVGDDMLSHQMAHLPGSLGTGQHGSLNRADISLQPDGDQPAFYLFDGREFDRSGFYGCIGSLNHPDEAQHFDEAQGILAHREIRICMTDVQQKLATFPDTQLLSGWPP